MLAAVAERDRLAVMELYGDLPAEQQDSVLRRSERRKIVLSTNIAESSVTIDGITAVVDSGLARVMRFDAGVGLDRLELTRISRASADQRAGRAGRTAPGLCVRMWSEHDDRGLRPNEEPEIARVDLSRAVLELRAWGEPDPRAFDWYQAPAPSALDAAEQLLRDLGAMDERGLTGIGQALARLPLPARIGRMLVEAQRKGCLSRASIAAAVLTERDPLRRGRDAAPLKATTAWESDLLERVLVLERFASAAPGQWPELNTGAAHAVLRVARDLQRTMRETPASPLSNTAEQDEAFLQSLLAAFPDRVARRRDRGSDRARMVGGRGVRLAADSVVQTAELFVCVEIDAGRRGERAEALVRQASAVDESWLATTRAAVSVEFDAASERVIAWSREAYRDLVLAEKSTLAPIEEAGALLARHAAAAPARALALGDTEVEQLLTRARCLAQWMPELDLPAFDQATLSDIAAGIAIGKRSFEEMRRVPLLDVLLAKLTYEQRRALDRHAPERLEVPSGSSIRLSYEPGRPPVLAARIQEMFGMRETPRIANGRVPVLVHLLAPNGRPQQVTDDLASFWRTTYGEVRKQLRARYPKHSWPEDPLTAVAQRRPGRR
ncbi:MAG TPA: ATP-dependent helicase C-terminal domain-containing protein, partial [Candidatus Binatia bacterium]|nr:ATP-dependent helicase C-terminal domain-containing protein [Candidatus Binatia bacterium]